MRVQYKPDTIQEKNPNPRFTLWVDLNIKPNRIISLTKLSGKPSIKFGVVFCSQEICSSSGGQDLWLGPADPARAINLVNTRNHSVIHDTNSFDLDFRSGIPKIVC